ncbi:bifunctional precorrin-2 dehydrogenase/sirohydrochlorin ferrochelatase [Clostridium sp. D2Q-11]|uniref:precorrin-2 dehydrogenase n=1 Tax=Anaeromonas frigoriresistens TaxID=2683708 RepID=A0A942Z8G3_9FIRM|nr:bifunctional precorrin-2 dehydrogenase/sirohydrochlorin ferrochelatase [Anaeromonas frigoriresistens]MBS4537890.1 bifunctional precorrin-2 dehydrogenase/sirohydrochlorin ferrochelatase [Anaeromonas frigoriresistens]
MLNLSGKKISIIGGGKVAFRKTLNLLEYSRDITVISPKFIKEFEQINDKINPIKSKYKEELIKGSFIIIAATDCRKTNKEISIYCKNNNILCNVVDDVDNSNFIVPSTFKRGDLSISVSTNGKSPSLSKKIRTKLEKEYPVDYEDYIKVLGEIREIILKKFQDSKKKKDLLNELVDLSYEELIERRKNYENSSGV